MKTIHRFRAPLAALTVAALAAGGLAFAQASGGLIPQGNAPDLYMLFTGDVIGYIDPCG